MVALKELYPTNPDERATVEDVLRNHPEARRFIERVRQYAQSTYDHPQITLTTRQYDEWDPPLTVEISADISQDDYGNRLLGVIEWANRDPDYNRDIVAVLLHSRKAAAF